jgi:hypothetical protein
MSRLRVMRTPRRGDRPSPVSRDGYAVIAIGRALANRLSTTDDAILIENIVAERHLYRWAYTISFAPVRSNIFQARAGVTIFDLLRDTGS